MKGPIKERWQELCEQAAIEQDPQRMIELVEEINRILTEKEQRLNAQRSSAANHSSQQMGSV
jgi:hypothetical protein